MPCYKKEEKGKRMGLKGGEKKKGERKKYKRKRGDEKKKEEE